MEDPIEDSEMGDTEDGGLTDPTHDPEADVPGIQGEEPLTFDDMFNWVQETIEEADLSGSISVGMSQGKLYIRFDNDVMFAPDSFALLPSGRAALNLIYPGIKAMNDYIATVEVAGHTAAVPGGGRGGINDWYLSSQRAVTVTDFLDFNARMVDSDKFQTAGYAQHQPYMSNEQEATRARNRRVELVITRNEFEVERTAEVIDMLTFDYQLGVIPGSNRKPDPKDHHRAEQIKQGLLQKYHIAEDVYDNRNEDSSEPINEWGPRIQAIPTLPDRPAENGNGAGDTE
jgi:outer membrane protein OmpA-like peptidoglycan-associated protein